MATRTPVTTIITITTMVDPTALLRLMSWLSPVFPTGGFAYSAGLEQAAADGLVADPATLERWIAAALTHGTAWNDAVLLAAGHRSAGDAEAIASLAELAAALNVSAERRRETRDQGTAFIEAAGHWFTDVALPPRTTPLPVAVGAAAGLSGIAVEPALAAFLNTLATNQLQCAIRLSVTGQTGAASVLAKLEPVIAGSADRASRSTLDDLGTAAFAGDIASQLHETLEPRLFLS